MGRLELGIMQQIKDKIHQIVVVFVVNARFFGCITNSLQEGRLAGVGTSDDENTEMFIFLSKVDGVLEVAHVDGRCTRQRDDIDR